MLLSLGAPDKREQVWFKKTFWCVCVLVSRRCLGLMSRRSRSRGEYWRRARGDVKAAASQSPASPDRSPLSPWNIHVHARLTTPSLASSLLPIDSPPHPHPPISRGESLQSCSTTPPLPGLLQTQAFSPFQSGWFLLRLWSRLLKITQGEGPGWGVDGGVCVISMQRWREPASNQRWKFPGSGQLVSPSSPGASDLQLFDETESNPRTDELQPADDQGQRARYPPLTPLSRNPLWTLMSHRLEEWKRSFRL